jgi:hypothetical protein
MARTLITATIFGLLAIGLLFLNINSPVEGTQKTTEFMLLLIGSVGSIFYLSGSKEGAFFEIRDSKDFINDISLGVVFGLASTLLTVMIIGGTKLVLNLFGYLDSSIIVSLSNEAKIFTIWFFPLTETLVLVGGFLLLMRVLPIPKKFGAVPLRAIGAILIVMTLFAAFHFNDRGKMYYEYSVAGFTQFIGNTGGMGTNAYHGALPQFILGGLWIVLAVAFRSWVVAAFAHVLNNAVSVGQVIGFGDVVVLGTLLLLAGITIVVYQRNQFSELSTFNVSGLYG